MSSHHAIFGKKLSRTKNERLGLIRNQMRSLVEHGMIKTSRAKAQAVRSEIEKLITTAKKGTVASKNDVIASFGDRVVAQTLIDMSTTRFATRTSGYTRMIKLGTRVGDAAEEVLFSFVDEAVTQEVIAPKTGTKEKVEVKKIEAPKKEAATKKPVRKAKTK